MQRILHDCTAGAATMSGSSAAGDRRVSRHSSMYGGGAGGGSEWRRSSRPMSLADRRRSSLYPQDRSQSLVGRRKSVSLCRFSVIAEAERRNSQQLPPDVTSSSYPDREEEELEVGRSDDPTVPHREYPPVAFFIVRQTQWPRSWCLKIITWPYPFATSAST